MRKIVFLILLTVILVLGYFFFSEKFSSRKTKVTVAKVIDGDTIELANGKKVRLLGIDAPEKNQYFYKEAKDKLKELVEEKTVVLESDASNSDSSGRLLRYVFVGSTFVNLELVKQGYANVYIVSPNEKYSSELLEAEGYARKNRLGIWKSFSFYNNCIKIKDFRFDARGNDKENLSDEYIVFKNFCSFEINLSGWSIKNRGSKLYVFPNISILPGEEITLFSGYGKDSSSSLYWNSSTPVWSNKGDTLYLRDENGSLVLIHSYP